jgi:Domain of unknown function (DUF4192)
MSSKSARIKVSESGTFIAVVPHLLGFHPDNSLVIIGIALPHGQVRLAFRYDLPDPPDQELTRDITAHAITVFHREHLTTAAVVGYGSGALVTPVADAFRHHLPAAGIQLADVLRVEDGRFWSYTCTGQSCCPPEGNPVNPDHPAAAALDNLGLTAAASRDDIAATIAPVTGDHASQMAEATRNAELAHAGQVAACGADTAWRQLMSAAKDAITSYRRGGTITDHLQLARIALALTETPIRDDAWARMQPRHRRSHQRLWTDVTRHAQPRYVAAPASLLAFTAWQDGNGVLATLAIDRALADDPGYELAQLIGEALHAGLHPTLARPPMTPKKVADSYRRQYQQ